MLKQNTQWLILYSLFYWYLAAYSLHLFAHVLGRGAVFAQNRVCDELLVLRQVKKHEKQSWCIIDYSD